MSTLDADQDSLKEEICDLERRLQDAKLRLSPNNAIDTLPPLSNNAALHALLLLSDSALPLGSFAFSSGLESYLAHHRPSPPSASQVPSFHAFLRLSLSTLASTALPYVLAGYRDPTTITTLDNDFDASTPCTVARRASIAQGRALLAVWDRSFKPQYSSSSSSSSSSSDGATTTTTTTTVPGQNYISSSSSKENEEPPRTKAIKALTALSTALPTSPHLHGHLAPLWGVVANILAIPPNDTAYLFLFSHARTVVSAAVRASVMGPYQAQGVLAGAELQQRIRGLVRQGWNMETEGAGQSVPVMDLWVGRHEKLYSRIFNS